MHRLLTLTEQQYLQLPAGGATQTKAASKVPLSKSKAGGVTNEALSDKGLVAWWTFEDGPDADLSDIRVDDITGKRFKTLVQRGNNIHGIVPKRVPSGEMDATTTTTNTNKKKKRAPVEYAYSHYDIADELLNGISFLVLSQPNLAPVPAMGHTPTDDSAVDNNRSEELGIASSSPPENEFNGQVFTV